MQHHITTTNFAISGDIAEGEIYSIATHSFVANNGENEVIVGGRYLDKYWAHVNDPSASDHPGHAAGTSRARRSVP